MKKLIFILITALTTFNCVAQQLTFTDAGIDYKFTKDSIFITNQAPEVISFIDVTYLGGGNFFLNIYTGKNVYIFNNKSMIKIGMYSTVQLVVNNYQQNEDNWLVETWFDVKQESSNIPPYDLTTTLTPKYDYVNVIIR
jgi:hypothetical protein